MDTKFVSIVFLEWVLCADKESATILELFSNQMDAQMSERSEVRKRVYTIYK